MKLLALSVILVTVSAVLVGPFSIWLSRAEWVARAPRSSVLLWQCTGLGAIVSGIGAGLAVAVYRYHVGFIRGVAELSDGLVDGHPLRGLGLYDALGLTLATDLAIVLGAVVAAMTVRTVRQRARHRQLVDLLAHPSTVDPRARVLPDDRAIAYCLPGLRPRIVLSEGTLHLLDSVQIMAVIEHERGHAHGRHGLVMLPMVSLRSLFGWIPYARLAPSETTGLLEMAADDFSCRRTNRYAMAAALVDMATSGWSPSCSFAFSRARVTFRVNRLLADTPPVSMRAMFGSLSLAAGVLAVPTTLLLLG